jgi:hypothetical protein
VVTCRTSDRMKGASREVQACGYVHHQHEVALAEAVQVSISDVQKVFPLIFDHLRQTHLILSDFLYVQC